MIIEDSPEVVQLIRLLQEISILMIVLVETLVHQELVLAAQGVRFNGR
jgi:hypothetical protein